jgi:hypothetical protein
MPGWWNIESNLFGSYRAKEALGVANEKDHL